MPRSLSIAVTLKKGDIKEKDGSKILPLKEEIMAAYPNDWKERKFRGKVVKVNHSASLEVVWIVNGAEHRICHGSAFVSSLNTRIVTAAPLAMAAAIG